MASTDKDKASAKKYADKMRALHTDEWYEAEGNRQVLKCAACGHSGISATMFYRQRRIWSGFSSYCRKFQLAKNKNNDCLRSYGITADERMRMFESNGGKCSICEVEMVRFHIDHCHSTGKVRGVLCSACNTALGHLKASRAIV